MSELSEFRTAVDDFMAHHPQSPLDWQQKAKFSGLSYYAPNDSLKFVAAIERFADDEPLFEMETSTGDKRMYRRWGKFSFMVDGEATELTIYSDPHGHDFFMPFRDATSGKETYGAGRYMDNHRPGMALVSSSEIEIDLNYAYNPYCAYNEGYSCPLPPRENWLKVPISAGEKKFKSS
ncbi:MAG: DUF1684 domain-containing protein [Anaerolineae bacterium]